MSTEFIVVRTCSADAYDAVPQRLMRIEISEALPALSRAGYRVLADAGRMCVLEKDGLEITLYSSGRVLVRIESAEAAEEAAKALYEALGVA
ncbi:MAG: hypothetical protein AB1665_04375 [Candidatus Thermoplasmatota archaeon]